jgi:predicted N-acetyltransferase YhbS
MGAYIFRTMETREQEAVLDLLERVFGERSIFDLYLRHDPALGPRDTLVAFCNEEPVSCVQIFTKRVRLRGKAALLGGIGSVATDPNHRHRGLASELLRRSIEEMQARGIVLSLLFTGRISFYERLGWVAIPQTRLALHKGRELDARSPDGVRIRRFREPDLPRVERLYEAYTEGFETGSIRDHGYWEGQLRYAGSPGEDFYVTERDDRLVAYARKVSLEGAVVAMEYAREADAAGSLAALLAKLIPSDGALILPWGGDEALEEALRGQADRIDRFPDKSLMWRALDVGVLADLAGAPPSTEDAPLLEALVGGPRALYWPSDRF